jgi:hypothetical protein
MAMSGETFSTLVREVWYPELKNTVWYNFWMFNQNYFQKLDSPGGSTLSAGYEYAVTTNVGTYNYDDAMVDPYNTGHVRAYFNKDPFQESARVFNVYLDYLKNGGSEVGALDYARKTVEGGIRNLRDKATTTMILDLISQIDSSSAYSDASLSRTTYATLKSYEEDTSTALTMAHLEDAVEALMTHTTYGQTIQSESDLLWLFPRNQVTNLSRLVTGQAYNASFFQMLTSTQDMGPADAGRVMRTKAFEGIEIAVVPDMTTTVILLVHKPDVKVYETRPLTIVEKSEKADTQLWHLTGSWNAIAERPGNHAKLSGKTA